METGHTNGMSGSAAPLYSFNIEELYDYDLPNIRRPSEALTAMASQPMRFATSKPGRGPTM